MKENRPDKALLSYAKQLLYLRILEQEPEELTIGEIDMAVLLVKDPDVKRALRR